MRFAAVRTLRNQMDVTLVLQLPATAELCAFSEHDSHNVPQQSLPTASPFPHPLGTTTRSSTLRASHQAAPTNSQASAEYLARSFGNSQGMLRVLEAKLFFPEEMPELIAQQALKLWMM
jgi:hypothetical protein